MARGNSTMFNPETNTIKVALIDSTVTLLEETPSLGETPSWDVTPSWRRTGTTKRIIDTDELGGKTMFQPTAPPRTWLDWLLLPLCWCGRHGLVEVADTKAGGSTDADWAILYSDSIDLQGYISLKLCRRCRRQFRCLNRTNQETTTRT